MALVTAAYLASSLSRWSGRGAGACAYEGAYGAGGTSIVPAGSDALVKTSLAPLGVVYAAGEEWSARSGSGAISGRSGESTSASSARRG